MSGAVGDADVDVESVDFSFGVKGGDVVEDCAVGL